MTKQQAADRFLAGEKLTIVELLAHEQKATNGTPEKPSKRLHSYKCLLGTDSVEVRLYERQGQPFPDALKFKRGQRAVVLGHTERGKYGLGCMADGIELLAE